MRPLWKGAISFGMVSIPIKLYSATEDRDVRLHLLHAKDLSPIKERRFCQEENVEVPWNDVIRGYDVGDGSYVPVDPEELEAVRADEGGTPHSIEIAEFVSLDEIDPIYFEKSYFLEPQDPGLKPYLLLRRALEETERIAIARVAIRTKERLATLRVYGNGLILETMYWPDEIRAISDLAVPSEEEAGKSAPSPKELQMARSLIDNLSEPFHPEQYTDRYRVALQELIERKMAGEERITARKKSEPKVIDLMDALKASIEASASGARSKPAESKSAEARAAEGAGHESKPRAAAKPAAEKKAPARTAGAEKPKPRRTAAAAKGERPEKERTRTVA